MARRQQRLRDDDQALTLATVAHRQSTRRLPLSAWLGLAIVAASEAGMLARVEPFWSWHTPIAWTGFIYFADGLVWQRRGESPIANDRAEVVFLALVSVPLWVIFEQYNKYFLHNWHYVGLPQVLLVRYIGYVWSFATIWPALFITAELVGSVRDRRAPEYRRQEPRRLPLDTVAWLSIVVGALMLILPIVFPSPWLAGPVWLGFIFLLDPINAHRGDESLRGDLSAGHPGRLVNLLGAGLLCGVIWECWNYWAHTKWVYTVPVPPNIKVFEMPLAGYLGFPVFAVECFTMYVFVRRWLWRGAWRPIAL
jgi:hypothetical protein